MGLAEKLIGFAIKANKIVYGTDNILKKRVFVILFSDSLSDVSLRKLLSVKKDIPIYKSITTPIENIVRKQNCKVIGITEEQMANAIINNIDNNYQRITLEEI